jgi:hypothetical protein
MDWWGFVWTVLSIFTGAVLTWIFSRRTSREVRLILRAFAKKSEAEQIEFVYNDKGEAVDFRLVRRVSDAASVSDDVDTQTRREDPA